MILGPAQVLSFSALASSQELYDGNGILHGWGWRNVSDVNRADVELWDGEGEKRIVPVTLCAGQSARDWLSGTGIEIRTGLYLVVNSGAVNVDLWFRPGHDAGLTTPFDLHAALELVIDTVFNESNV